MEIISVYAQIKGPQGVRSLRMALDTGASFTMIPPEKAVSVGHVMPVTKEHLIKIFTASGVEYVPRIKILSLTSLGVTVKNIEVICHTLPDESSVEGLLGLNFLTHIPAFKDFLLKLNPFLHR